MTIKNFSAWLRAALPGETYTYHVGLLMRDRQRETHEPQWEETEKAGARAWAAYEAKQVALTQRRVAPGRSEYIATRL
jgi:hypothetical protein